MPRFTKEQMFDEFRTIFLFEADHILMGAGPEMATEFIGFDTGEDDEYCHRPPADVDLSRFQIVRIFDGGYDYAFRPSVVNTLGEHNVQDMIVFMEGVPKVGGISSGGETHRYMTPEGLCQTVADAVAARWKLEWDTQGGHDLTTRELALLAEMTEGAVRNALADKSENGLRAIPGTRNPVMVDHSEALRWLKGRRGFIPSPRRASEDRFLSEQIQNAQTAEGLGRIVRYLLADSFRSSGKSSEALSWTPSMIEDWERGRQVFDLDQAMQLAKAIDVDAPLFVGKALELTLRRDLSSAPEGRS